MGNRPATVTAAEITRSVKGAMAAGFAVGRIEVDHMAGKVIIFPMGVSSHGEVGPDPDELLKQR
ncbi:MULTISPECIES: hypothetical protein [Paracoccus]|uniref:hypothetical protein n=1 Tax=Paracoccus TaxID=265 RepID=UPI000E21D6F1|nr:MULTISPECIES: hypothetical protein [Paracoccus]WGR55290.1 hypothetical protein E3U25_04545 [Paracoccus versutus]